MSTGRSLSLLTTSAPAMPYHHHLACNSQVARGDFVSSNLYNSSTKVSLSKLSITFEPNESLLPIVTIMPLPRRAVIFVTSATAPWHGGRPTGLFISNALNPYQVLTAAGFAVDFVSDKGTYVADWLRFRPFSLTPVLFELRAQPRT